MSALSGDMPTFIGSAHQSATYGLASTGGLNELYSSNTTANIAGNDHFLNAIKSHDSRRIAAAMAVAGTGQHQKQEQPMSQFGRRLVQVIVVDPNENVPLENCIIYKGEEKLTDLNDQELFFELDIKNLLTAHNEKRVTFIDKKVKERTEHLEPAKIRDLKMVVVTVASF